MFNDIRDDLVDLDARTSPVTSGVMAFASTTSVLYGDLVAAGPTASPGPACVVPIGLAGKALVSWSATLYSDIAGNASLMSVALSGGYTLGAADDWSKHYDPYTANAQGGDGVTMLFTLLTAGSVTFTTKHRIYAAGGTASAQFRRLIVQPVGA